MDHNRYPGKAIIVVDLESGDCVRFSSIVKLRIACGIHCPSLTNFEELRERKEFKEKYLFFAFENDLLRYAD